MTYRVRGQSLVEFALVAPIMIFLIMGIIDFSFYIYTYSEIENATRRASEYMSKAARTSCENEAKIEAIENVFFTELTAAQMAVQFTPATPELGGKVSVSVQNYPVRFLTPIGNGLFSGAQLNFTSERIILSINPPHSKVC